MALAFLFFYFYYKHSYSRIVIEGAEGMSKEQKLKTLSLRISEEDLELAKKYSKVKGRSVSELLRDSLLEKIEDYMDYQDAVNALKEYEQDEVSFDTDTVKRVLGE